jgi:hypothetical protein
LQLDLKRLSIYFRNTHNKNLPFSFCFFVLPTLNRFSASPLVLQMSVVSPSNRVVVIFFFARTLFNIAGNGSALGAVADFGAQNCQYTTKVDAR